MSSEAITRNDLKAILDEVLPPSASEYKKLLWTNPNPTASFSAQTISLDLSEYDDVEVEFKVYPSEDVVNVASAGIGEVGVCSTVRTDTWLTQARTFTVSATGVAFSDCRLGSNASVYNNHSVPLKIYGIKYERVQPPVLDAEIEVLATGATLYRIGRIRILSLVDFLYGTSITIGVGDRPTTKAVGFGTRHNGSAYITMLRMEVATSGSVGIFLVGYYNTTTGYTGVASGDVYNAIAIWYVAE